MRLRSLLVSAALWAGCGGGASPADLGAGIVDLSAGVDAAVDLSAALDGALPSDLAAPDFADGGPPPCGPGDRDPAFGSSGTVSFPTGFSAGGVVAQPDGKLLVFGSIQVAATYSGAILRFAANGAPDLAFGSNGLATATITGKTTVAFRAAAIQADSKIVVVGETDDGSADLDIAVARFGADGVLDSGFGGGAFALSYGAGSHEFASAVAVQSTGEVVLAGFTAAPAANASFAVVRLTSAGALDTTFATTGMTTMSFGGDDTAEALALGASGAVIVVGNSSLHKLVIGQLDAAGAPDATFGTSGLASLTFTGQSSIVPSDLLRLSDGSLLVVGATIPNGQLRKDTFVAKLGATGTPDATFGTGGLVVYNAVPTGDDTPYFFARRSDGKMILSGNSYTGSLASFDSTKIGPLLLRLDAAGAVDSSFSRTAISGNASLGRLALSAAGGVRVLVTAYPTAIATLVGLCP